MNALKISSVQGRMLVDYGTGNVPYKMLITGFTNKNAEVAASLPMLNNFEAFPTLIIIDKKGAVRKIHTGFSGPGTGKYYSEFVQEFEKTIDDLLAEN